MGPLTPQCVIWAIGKPTATTYWVHACGLQHLWSLILLEPSVASHHPHTGPSLRLSTTCPLRSQWSAHAACAPWAISPKDRILAAWKALSHTTSWQTHRAAWTGKIHTANGLVQPRSNSSSLTNKLSKPNSPPCKQGG